MPFGHLLDRAQQYLDRLQQSDNPQHHQPQQQTMDQTMTPPPTSSQPTIPKLRKQPVVLGLLNDPGLNRDSIAAASARFGNRVLWTCRDTQLMNPEGKVQQWPVISSTASWTDFWPQSGEGGFGEEGKAIGQQEQQPLERATEGGQQGQHCRPGGCIIHHCPHDRDAFRHTALRAYGTNSTQQAFFPVLKGQGAPPAGGCHDGNRFAIWPDAAPLVVHADGQGGTAYCWIKNAVITNQLASLVDDPATALHRIEYDASRHCGDALPDVKVVDVRFWGEGEIPYGVYGGVVHDGWAYLYGQTSKNVVALARVRVDEVEDRGRYEYFVNGKWTGKRPGLMDGGIGIKNCSAGGQGTYYFSPAWGCFVWIGGSKFPGAQFWVTTAPRPEGPWIQPFMFWEGKNGNHGLGAYSLQANPALVNWERGNGIYLTYTKEDDFEGDGSVYTTPLVWVEWE
ncbi:hypothetical protein K470DRAFT_276503 [Piedraia hortae CBS 480.64]|uniref:DUF4185 domain-containing protein n=1 Tax=Piedraia hortae CBS 480.64 TaxID=1314780 RepID=A0A6A7C0T2_9PEZI|nr:hypothetical protein K470DRAFT_276503 [Piedraia hortae CBS 480.64]